MSLRILYVITDLLPGGVPLHLYRLATHMSDAGHDVAVVSLAAGGVVADRLTDHGVTVMSCDACCALDWRVFDRLGGYIQQYQPQIVHSFLFHANNAARASCVLTGFPRERLICEIQTAEIERRWHLWVDRFMHRFSRVTVGNSKSVVDHLHQRARIPGDKLHLIEGGVDVEAVGRAEPYGRAELNVNENETLLLWAGRLDPVKGLDTLIAAVDRVRAGHPVRLLLAGEGDYRPTVERLIESHQLQSVVTMLGHRDDVHRLMRTADIFVFPSRTEGMPNALLEAMAAGCPVITTSTAGCRDVVTENETGMLVDVDQPEQLTVAITRLITDRPLTNRLAQHAARHARKRFAISTMFQRYANLYSAVEASDAPSHPN